MVFQSGGIIAVKDRTIREEVHDILETHPLEHRETYGLSGNIFTIQLGPGETPFMDLATREHVRSLILKLVVIKDKREDKKYQMIINGEAVSKQTLTTNDFMKESKTQQYVWANSIANGGIPLCPPIIDTLILDTRNIHEFSPRSYLRAFFEGAVIPTRNTRIGVMVMPMVTNDVVDFYDFFIGKVEGKNTVGLPNLMMAVCSNIVAQVLRLFLEIRVVNLDLNDGNILLYRNGKPMLSDEEINIHNNPYNTIMIDFGNSTILSNGKDDGSFNAAEKAEYNQAINLFLVQLTERPYTPEAYTPDEKVELIRGWMGEIIQVNANAPINRYTGSNYILELTRKIEMLAGYPGFSVPQLYIGAFDLLLASMNQEHRDTTRNPMSELDGYIHQGKMYDYREGPRLRPAPDFASPPPPPPPPPPAPPAPTSGMPSFSLQMPSFSLQMPTQEAPSFTFPPPPPPEPVHTPLTTGLSASATLTPKTPSPVSLRPSVPDTPVPEPEPESESATENASKRIRLSKSVGGKKKRTTKGKTKKRKSQKVHKRKKSAKRNGRKTKRQ